MNKYVAIFDLDGTLVDSPSLIIKTFIEVFSSLSIAPPNEHAIRRTIGMPLPVAFSTLLLQPPESTTVLDAVEKYQSFFKEIVLPRASRAVFPGVHSGLDCLRKNSIALAIATNKFTSSADALLKACSLDDYFDITIGSDAVIEKKPHPESVYLILKHFSALPENACMVGDTGYDISMAHAAGISSIAVDYGIDTREQLIANKAQHICSTFAQVYERILLKHKSTMGVSS